MTTGERLKNSVGIWAYSDMLTRFLAAGYHPEAKGEEMVERTERVVEGLGDLVDGYEYHYSGEVNERRANTTSSGLQRKRRSQKLDTRLSLKLSHFANAGQYLDVVGAMITKRRARKDV